MTGWKCSFNRSKSKIPVIKSSQTVLQLLHGFFMYYHNFNFSKDVICPLIGLPICKQFFSNSPQDLPLAMETYVHRVTKDKHAERFRTKCSMCVQDPFDLSHNLTKGTSGAMLQKFKILCGLSGDTCAKLDNWTETLFPYLFNTRGWVFDLFRVLLISVTMYDVHVFGCKMLYTPYLYIQVNLFVWG